MFDTNRDDGPDHLYELERESKVRELITHLKRSEKSYVRRRAAEMLGNVRGMDETEEHKTVDALIRTVRGDDDDRVRAAAVEALNARGEDAFDRLVEELADVEFEGDGRAAVELLGEWLDADRAEFRMVAATALGERGVSAAVPKLISRFADPDPRVRSRAVRACGQLGDPRTVDALAARLDDDRALVREAAARALADVGTERALEALVPLTRADDESLRLIAVDRLAEFGSLEPTRVLADALADPSNSVRRVALFSLLELFARAGDAAEDADRERALLAERLREADADATVRPLLEVARDGAQNVRRRHAIWLLGRVVDADDGDADDLATEVVACLVDRLDDRDETTADLAADGLRRIGGPETEKRLRTLLRGESGPEAAHERAEAVLEDVCEGDGGELVRTSVDYTYVADPSDYGSGDDGSGGGR